MDARMAGGQPGRTITRPAPRPGDEPELDVLRVLLDSLGIGSAALSGTLRVRRCSPLLLDLLGRSPHDAEGLPLTTLVPAVEPAGDVGSLRAAVRDGRGSWERALRLPDGSPAVLTALAVRSGLAVLAVRPTVDPTPDTPAAPATPTCRTPTATGRAGRRADPAPTTPPDAPADRTGRPAALHGEDIAARILEGVAAGASTRELARSCYLSPQGVEYHIVRLMRRLECANRPSLVARAYATGLLRCDSWPPRLRDR